MSKYIYIYIYDANAHLDSQMKTLSENYLIECKKKKKIYNWIPNFLAQQNE